MGKVEIIHESGHWKYNSDEIHSVSQYSEALIRYFNIFDPVFLNAKNANEFEFLMSLFNIKGIEDAGWNPYETTLRALRVIADLHGTAKGGEAQRHLELWLYGHIVEASEPYEMIMNLLSVKNGDKYNSYCFPPGKNEKPQSPGAKIQIIDNLAKKVGLPNAVTPLKEIWNRYLRNSIFHADYALFGGEVRTRNPMHIYSHDQITTLSNRALAYIESLSALHKIHIQSYQQPKIIRAPDLPTPAVVLVSEGYGAIGMQAALTKEEIKAGHILWRIGMFTSEEKISLEADPTIWLLPARTQKHEQQTNS